MPVDADAGVVVLLDGRWGLGGRVGGEAGWGGVAGGFGPLDACQRVLDRVRVEGEFFSERM
jgi:hypothetical protein